MDNFTRVKPHYKTPKSMNDISIFFLVSQSVDRDLIKFFNQ